MRISARVLRTFTAALSVAAVMGVCAGSAFAELVPTTWSTTGAAKAVAPESIVVEKNGGSATSCTQTGSPTGFVGNGEAGGSFFFYNTPELVLQFNCTGGTKFNMVMTGSAKADGAARFLEISKSPSQFLTSPWGGYYQTKNPLVPFTNGSGGTPSKVAFSDTVIGERSFPKDSISVTGVLNITTGAGGLLTLK